MKKMLIMFLVLLLMISCFSTWTVTYATEPPRRYDDVSYDSWYAGAVDYVSWGLMEGDGEKFFPERILTRAELAMIIVRFAHINLREFTYEKSPFEDVRVDSWYGKAVSWVKENGLMIGTSSATFKPNDIVTREQLCVTLARLAEYRGNTNSEGSATNFTDSNEISVWAVDGVNYMITRGIFKGTPENKILPQKGITRAETAMVLSRFSKTASSQ